MKKLRFKTQAWLTRRARKRMRYRRLRMLSRRHLLALASASQASLRRIVVTVNGRDIRGWARERVPMPENFCLEENYEETARCIADIRSRLEAAYNANQRRRRKTRTTFPILDSYNDFTAIKRCSPSAALVLAAEYDISRSLRPWSIPLIELQKWQPELVAMLDEIGFFNLLEIARPGHKTSHRAIRILPFQTAAIVGREDVAGITGELKSALISAVPGLQADEDFQATLMQLLGAIQEATENSCHHAYRNTTIPEGIKRWWATGAINIEERHLNLSVYDHGRSIPDTLPEWDKYPFIRSRLARFSRFFGGGDDDLDAIKIRLAMDAPRSSTGLSHRGKGFPLFKSVVAESRQARLRILSRRGEFIYEKGRHPAVQALNTPLNGTLVEWDLWL